MQAAGESFHGRRQLVQLFSDLALLRSQPLQLISGTGGHRGLEGLQLGSDVGQGHHVLAQPVVAGHVGRDGFAEADPLPVTFQPRLVDRCAAGAAVSANFSGGDEKDSVFGVFAVLGDSQLVDEEVAGPPDVLVLGGVDQVLLFLRCSVPPEIKDTL